MKKIIFFFFLAIHVAYSQTYHVVYHKTANLDSGFPNSDGLSVKRNKVIKNILANLVEVYYLENKNGQSKFYFDHALVKGEIDKDPRRYVNRRFIYKDFSDGVYYYEWFDRENDEDEPERKALITGWKIDATRDTTIAGFYCKRATLVEDENTITAWYAPSIPIMDGPFKYAGLPGLIIRLKTKTQIIEVVDIQVITDDKTYNANKN